MNRRSFFKFAAVAPIAVVAPVDAPAVEAAPTETTKQRVILGRGTWHITEPIVVENNHLIMKGCTFMASGTDAAIRMQYKG